MIKLEEHDFFQDFRLPENMKLVIGKRVGLIKDIYEFLVENEDPYIYNFSARNSYLERLLGISQEIKLNAGGPGISIRDGLLRSIGEIVERYSMFTLDIYKSDELLVDSYKNLRRKGIEAVGPDKMKLFAEEQYKKPGFPYERFTEDTVISWIKGIDLVSKKEVYVPAQLAGEHKLLDREKRIAYATSSGVAARNSYEGALLHGLYEVIERDAIMINWYSGLTPPHLDISSSPRLMEFKKRVEGNSLKCYTLYITLDIPIHAVLALCIDIKMRDPVYTIGGAANLDPEDAVFKALLEAAQGYIFVKYLKIQMGNIQIDPYNIYDLETNLRFYSYPDNLKYLERLLESNKVIRLEDIYSTSDTQEDPKNSLTKAINILKEYKLTPIALDLTPPEIAELGLYVTRVIIPELVPFSVPSLPFAGNPRFYEIPVKLGLREKPLTYSELVKLPHPFP